MTIESKNNNQILWDFLSDAKNIKEYKCNYVGLEKLYVKARKILESKTFDIDFKDDLGNNFIHIAMREDAFEEVYLLMQAGVDLSQKNNAGKIAGYESKHSFKFYDFLKKFSLYAFRLKWNEKTNGFHINTKQFLFDYYANNMNFMTFDECNQFLQENNLKTIKNQIQLITSSKQYEPFEVYDWFKINIPTHDKEHNTFFLYHFTGINKLDKPSFIDFFQTRDIDQSDFANKTIKHIYNLIDRKASKIDYDFVKQLVEYTFKQNADIEYRDIYINESILEGVEKNQDPKIRSVFYSVKLKDTLPTHELKTSKSFKV